MESRDLTFAQNPGEKVFLKREWNKDKSELVVVEEIDIQKEIDEAAKGMTIGEQLSRLAYGDTSVLRPGEPQYGDVSGYPETAGEMIIKGQQIAVESNASVDQRLAEIEENLKGYQPKEEEKDAYAKALNDLEIAKARVAEMRGKKNG